MELSKLSLTNTSELAKDLSEGGGISYRAELADEKIFWKAHVRRASGELCRLLKVHGKPADKVFRSSDGLFKFHKKYFPHSTVLHLPLGLNVWSDYHYVDGSHSSFKLD